VERFWRLFCLLLQYLPENKYKILVEYLIIFCEFCSNLFHFIFLVIFCKQQLCVPIHSIDKSDFHWLKPNAINCFDSATLWPPLNQYNYHYRIHIFRIVSLHLQGDQTCLYP
jgi:hypothetical protein